MSTDRRTLFTIGHSTHSFDAFVALLKQNDVTAVADVRSHPYSRRLDQYNREELAARLKASGIQYVFLGQELGARRDEPECYDGDEARYDRIAELPRFQEGLARLRRGADDYRIAMMCAEKDPLDCHRTVLVCRQLRDELQIQHILADGTVENHADAENRLARKMNVTRTLFEPDLTGKELIERAYDERAHEIAYRTKHEGSPQ